MVSHMAFQTFSMPVGDYTVVSFSCPVRWRENGTIVTSKVDLPVDVGNTQLRGCHSAGRYCFLYVLDAVNGCRRSDVAVGIARFIGVQRLKTISLVDART